MSDNTDYNGWTNRETWAVALHIGSSEEIYRPYRNIAIELARQAKESHPEDWINETNYACTRVFEEMVKEDFSLDTYYEPDKMFTIPKHFASAINDIGSVGRVDYREIGKMMAEMGIEVIEKEEE
ncbi:hypothetical protein N9N26_00685 [Candidatus Poseidoniales archaeon]|jgi:hypothetical protein|nr:hypothetical protein [Candidatus Poseidoniales archaeon]